MSDNGKYYENNLPSFSYPLEVEWAYHDIGERKKGIRGLMFAWCKIQWQGDDTFSHYGDHIFKITDKKVKEYLK